MEKYKILYSEKEIWFSLEFKSIKNLNLSIKPDQSVYVSAPLNTPIEVIESFVKAKANWILKKIKGFDLTKSLNIAEKGYVSGETFKYLGRQYRLKIETTTENEYVSMKHGYIVAFVKNKDNKKRKQTILNEWFRKRAQIIFQDVIDETYSLVENIVKSKPSLEIKIMKKRWGSCLKSKNTILLNYELIKAPKHCISYVVLHELIHFVYRNHDTKFYDLLTVLMPDWKERKAILDEEIALLV